MHYANEVLEKLSYLVGSTRDPRPQKDKQTINKQINK